MSEVRIRTFDDQAMAINFANAQKANGYLVAISDASSSMTLRWISDSGADESRRLTKESYAVMAFNKGQFLTPDVGN